MKIISMILTGLLAVAGIVIGGVNMIGGLAGFAAFSDAGSLGAIEQAAGYPVIDNSTRFLGGVFVGVGLGFAYCLKEMSEKILLLRFLLLGIFIGGIARVIGWAELGMIDSSTIPPTIVELVFPPAILLLLHFSTQKERRA